jgi:hypothetical protein
MTKTEQDKWKEKKSGEIFIGAHYFHHHASEKLTSSFKEDMKKGLCGKIDVEPIIRELKNKTVLKQGITSTHLNKELKSKMKANINNLKLEVQEEDGVYYDGGKIGGFDFAVINDENNLINLYNNCYGSKHYDDGGNRWSAFIAQNDSLKGIANKIKENGVLGKNMVLKNKKSQIIVGEMQFGNWGLVYRDFFKLLKANVQTDVDCLIFVTDTGSLENLLSDGIVTYSNTKALLIEFAKVLTVPIWLIGLDIKNIK